MQAPENHSDPIFLFNLRTVTTTDGDINYESIYNSTNPIFHYFLVTPPSNNLIEVDMTTGIVTLDPMNSLVSAYIHGVVCMCVIAMDRQSTVVRLCTDLDVRHFMCALNMHACVCLYTQCMVCVCENTDVHARHKWGASAYVYVINTYLHTTSMCCRFRIMRFLGFERSMLLWL